MIGTSHFGTSDEDELAAPAAVVGTTLTPLPEMRGANPLKDYGVADPLEPGRREREELRSAPPSLVSCYLRRTGTGLTTIRTRVVCLMITRLRTGIAATSFPKVQLAT